MFVNLISLYLTYFSNLEGAVCIQEFSKSKTPKSKFRLNNFTVYSMIILLGIISGSFDFAILQNIGSFISNIFIKMFKCVSLPIISLSIIVTLSQYNANQGMKQIWQRTLLYTISTTIIAASVAFTLYLLIAPSNINSIDLNTVSQVATSNNNYLEHLAILIPTNIFSPFLEHQVMGVLFISMIMGLAIRCIPNAEPRNAVINFFKGTHEIFIVITNWIVKIIPIGLYGFITTTIVQLKTGMDLRGLSGYLTVVILANLIQGLVILPIWLYINNIKPFATMRAMLPALSIAFFSKSSTGTLPVTMETAEKNLMVSPHISKFVLPLCTTINMNGCAAFIFTTVIYMMQNHGIEINLTTMMLWILIATIAAIGNAGVPMGCFFLSASLLTSMDVPITLLGLILPFYSIIDMVETTLNVWSDSCVVKVVNEKDKINNSIIVPNEIY
jgi:Na+/H+-dicarboxylate symporter